MVVGWTRLVVHGRSSPGGVMAINGMNAEGVLEPAKVGRHRAGEDSLATAHARRDRTLGIECRRASDLRVFLS